MLPLTVLLRILSGVGSGRPRQGGNVRPTPWAPLSKGGSNDTFCRGPIGANKCHFTRRVSTYSMLKVVGNRQDPSVIIAPSPSFDNYNT
jgi:hypothetical protein